MFIHKPKKMLIYFFIITFALFKNSLINSTYSNNFQTALKLAKQKKYRQAIKYLKIGINNNTNNYWVYNNIVNCYMKINQRKKALYYAKLGYKKFPNNKVMKFTIIWALHSNGWQSIRDKNIKKSINYFRIAVLIDKNNAGSWNGYGVALRKSEKSVHIHKSVIALLNAFILKPNIKYIFLNLQTSFYKSFSKYLKDCKILNALKLAEKWKTNFMKYIKYYKKYKYSKFKIISSISSGLKYLCSKYKTNLTQKNKII